MPFRGDALDFRCGAAVDDHFANVVGQIEQFGDCGAAVISGAGHSRHPAPSRTRTCAKAADRDPKLSGLRRRA